MSRWKNTQLTLAQNAAASAGKRSRESLDNGISQGVLQERSRIAQILGVDIETIASLGSDQSEISIQTAAGQPEDPKPVIEGEA